MPPETGDAEIPAGEMDPPMGQLLDAVDAENSPPSSLHE